MFMNILGGFGHDVLQTAHQHRQHERGSAEARRERSPSRWRQHEGEKHATGSQKHRRSDLSRHTPPCFDDYMRDKKKECVKQWKRK